MTSGGIMVMSEEEMKRSGIALFNAIDAILLPSSISSMKLSGSARTKIMVIVHRVSKIPGELLQVF